MKKLYSIKGNSQKLDGGAMFGNAPKAMWQKWLPVDSQNRIDLACRALLIQEEGRNILLEVGVGAFFEPKLKERFGIVESQHVLLESLAEVGLTHQDIDILILSHLHFDHAGGLLSEWQADKEPELLFPNAQFLVGKEAWQRARNPHPRDRASFVPPMIKLLEASGRVHQVTSDSHALLGDDYSFHFSHGHTPGMMLTEINLPEGPLVFCADLIPGEAWVHLPITMGYDRFAEMVIDEKQALLEDLIKRHGRLFFTHDATTAAGRLTQNDRNKFSIKDPQAELIGMSL